MFTTAVRLIFAGAVLLSTASLSAGVQKPQPQDRELDAREVWERVIAAKGGREKLRAIHTIAWSGDHPSTQLDRGSRHVEVVEAFPDRQWMWENLVGSVGIGVTVWNLERRVRFDAWDGRRARMSWPENDLGLTSVREHRLMFLLESRYVSPSPQRAIERGNAIHLTATAGDLEAGYEIDRNTWLPSVAIVRKRGGGVVFVRPGQQAQFRHELKEYRSIDGIQMPSHVSSYGQMKFEFNPNIDPALFETAPDGVTDRSSWRINPLAKRTPAVTGTYAETNFGFSVEVPSGLKAAPLGRPSPRHGIAINFPAGSKLTASAMFDLSSLGSIDSLAEETASNFADKYPGLVVIKREETTLGGLRAIDVTMGRQGEPNGPGVRAIVTLRGQLDYSVVLEHAAATTARELEAFNQFVYSFNLIDRRNF